MPQKGQDMTFYDAPGFEDYYQFNLAGQVRTKPRYANSPICGGKRLIPSRPVNVRPVKGYPCFNASVDGRKTTVYIHRLIAKLFVPNEHGNPHVNHIDGDKANFAPENLEWCTHLENMRHAYRTGLAVAPKVGPGEASPAAKLNDDKVRQIRARLLAGETQRSIARVFGVSAGTVAFIGSRTTWAHVK